MKLFVNHIFLKKELTSGILFTLILTKYSRKAGSWELRGQSTEDTPQLLLAVAQGKKGGHLQYSKQPPVAEQTPALPKTKQ